MPVKFIIMKKKVSGLNNINWYTSLNKKIKKFNARAILYFNFISKLRICLNVSLPIRLYAYLLIFVTEIYPNY